MNLENFARRSTIVVEVSDLHREFLHPENITVQLDKRTKAIPIDIGSWCFSKREARFDGVGGHQSNRAVAINSLLEHRRRLVIAFCDYMYTCGHRDKTKQTYFNRTDEVLEWCDSNGHELFLLNEAATVAAYQAYTDWLFHRIRILKDLNPYSARRKQLAFLNIFALLYTSRASELTAQAQSIAFMRPEKAAPAEQAVHDYLDVIFPFVRNLKSALMNKEDFPLKIHCGSYDVAIFATNGSNVTSPYAKKLKSAYHPDGRYRTWDEYVDERRKRKPNITLDALRTGYKRSKANAVKINASKGECRYRRAWANHVMRGYAILIQALTGMSPTELTSLEYSKGLDVVSDSVQKDLVTVKFRAAGKKVYYTIGGRKGLKLLNEYLAFRDWYLQGQASFYLFCVNADKRLQLVEAKPLPVDFNKKFYYALTGDIIDPAIKNITSGDFRKVKSILLKKLGVSLKDTAHALNHTEHSNMQAYNKPSVDDMKTELAYFWNSVKSYASTLTIKKASDNDQSDSIAVGHCGSFGEPELICTDAPINPSCSKQYGCLYCKHYVCHADEEDVMKLLCLKYVINAVRDTVPDAARGEEIFRDISVRVEAIIQRIKILYPDMVEVVSKARKNVFELGILTPFWESRLSRYEEMGVVL
jgi:hypothetical protein